VVGTEFIFSETWLAWRKTTNEKNDEPSEGNNPKMLSFGFSKRKYLSEFYCGELKFTSELQPDFPADFSCAWRT
jgi:hypothetical protein